MQFAAIPRDPKTVIMPACETKMTVTYVAVIYYTK
jgi:hypothetical protein